MPTRFLTVSVCLLVGAGSIGFLGCAFAARDRPRRTLYVSVTGSDRGSGTKGQPLRSIQAALGRAEPGDTVRVADPSAVPDASDGNAVIDNTIATYAAECVDIKEAAEHNHVIGNSCSHSRDPKGSGLSARGSHNVFRGNVVSVSEGAGISFGRYGVNDGTDNSAVDNVLVANRGYGLLVLSHPQARICGNVIRQSGLGIVNARGIRPSARC